MTPDPETGGGGPGQRGAGRDTGPTNPRGAQCPTDLVNTRLAVHTHPHDTPCAAAFLTSPRPLTAFCRGSLECPRVRDVSAGQTSPENRPGIRHLGLEPVIAHDASV